MSKYQIAAADRGRMTAFRGMLSLRPPRQLSRTFGKGGFCMGKKKTAPGKAAAPKRSAPKQKPAAGRRKPAPTKEVLPVPIISEDELAAHFPAVEAAARAGQLE